MMYFVAPLAQEEKWAVLTPPVDHSLPPLKIGFFDTEEEADLVATRLNDAIGLDDELEDVPAEMNRLIMSLG